MSRLTLPLMILVVVLTALFSLSLGQYRIPVRELLDFVAWKTLGLNGISEEKKVLLENILFNIRLPRVLAAILIGASLSVSGAAFQALFVNPLVSPGLLGVLAGASFGAAFGMIFSNSWLIVQLSTLIFGFIAVGATLGIARVYRSNAIIMLVLGGIISGAFFTSLLSILKYTADPYNQLPAIVYWLMGSLASVDRGTVLIISLPAIIGILIIILHARQINILSMGEEEAQSLGVNVQQVRLTVIFAATMISALTVVVGGMIGWVGLIIPHICRMVIGPNNEALLPVAALTGAVYLLLIDDISRLLFIFEIPIGIVTSITGIPFFVLVLRNARRGGWR
ncbi:MAG: iron ABC transporter permease [Deltaproteobacteria bacterium]